MAATLAPFRLNARLAALTIVAVLAVACSSSSPTETPAPTPTNAAAVASATATAQLGYTPAFEGAACEFEVPADERVRCGWLVVPEDRSDPSGTQVRLHVAIFRSRSGNPEADPVVYLEGGPGGHALETVPFVFDLDFAPFLANRDFIMFDQRGAGYSEPSLYCQERVDLTYELLPLDLTTAEIDQRLIEVLNACRDRLRAEGANLAF